MNRLREAQSLPQAALWRLAAAYYLAGQPETARALVKDGDIDIKPYQELSVTYGSDLRDKAMVLEALFLMDMADTARPLAMEISEALSGERWLSTQTTAYALIAMARFSGLASGDKDLRCSFSWTGGGDRNLRSDKPFVQESLPVPEGALPTIKVTNNGKGTIFPRLVLSGLPQAGSEREAGNGMQIDVVYEDVDGEEIDPSTLEQGTDLRIRVIVKNTGNRGTYEEVALSHIVPSGWEIRNERMDPTARISSADIEYQDIRDDRVYTYFDLRMSEEKSFEVLVHASYLGRFYLPLVEVEAMYDATINARAVGQWVEVVRPGS